MRESARGRVVALRPDGVVCGVNEAGMKCARRCSATTDDEMPRATIAARLDAHTAVHATDGPSLVDRVAFDVVAAHPLARVHVVLVDRLFLRRPPRIRPTATLAERRVHPCAYAHGEPAAVGASTRCRLQLARPFSHHSTACTREHAAHSPMPSRGWGLNSVEHRQHSLTVRRSLLLTRTSPPSWRVHLERSWSTESDGPMVIDATSGFASDPSFAVRTRTSASPHVPQTRLSGAYGFGCTSGGCGSNALM